MERMTWQVRQVLPNKKVDLEDLGEWEPFGFHAETGAILVKRQVVVEGDKSSHEPGMLSFDERHSRPYDQDNDPED